MYIVDCTLYTEYNVNYTAESVHRTLYTYTVYNLL